MDGCIYRSQFDMCEKSKEEDEKIGIRRWCDFDGCEDKHPSNADRIRAMSDEDLAEFVAQQRFCALSPIADKLGIDITQMSVKCRDIMLDWLRQEASND